MKIESSEPSIYVKFTVPGFHLWRDATERRAYLSVPHRHLFHFMVIVHDLNHDDRDIEFHDLLDTCRDWVTNNYPPAMTSNVDRYFGESSCESIARKLAEFLVELTSKPITVRVSEDNECGAAVSARQSLDDPELQ